MLNSHITEKYIKKSGEIECKSEVEQWASRVKQLPKGSLVLWLAIISKPIGQPLFLVVPIFPIVYYLFLTRSTSARLQDYKQHPVTVANQRIRTVCVWTTIICAGVWTLSIGSCCIFLSLNLYIRFKKVFTGFTITIPLV